MANAQTRLVKRSLTIAGHRTSVSLEDAFWTALKRLADREAVSLAALAARVDASRGEANLSSALRVHVLQGLGGDAHASVEEQEAASDGA